MTSTNNDALNPAIFEFVTRLGDDRLILGHKLSEWCGHAPILEEDLALSNIALDLIGQASSFLKYAGEIEGLGRSEDDLAYKRIENEFRNSLLSEQPNGDFAVSIAKQFFFDTFAYYLFSELINSTEEKLAALAAKSLKEITYHLRHSSQWVIRLGDGTDESHQRMQTAINDLWMFTGDLFAQSDYDNILIENKIIPQIKTIKEKWDMHISTTLSQATLVLPPTDAYMQTGSRNGIHTEYLGYILADMQYLPSKYPDAKW